MPDVTYFFNGGREQEWEGETRYPCPVAARRGHVLPEARDVAAEVAERFAAELPNGYRFALNYVRTRTWSGTRA